MREYSISTGGATVSGTTTLIYVLNKAAVASNLEFLRWWVSQSGSTTSAQQRVQLALNSGTGVTVTAFTPTKMKEQDTASIIVSSTNGAAGTCGINATVETTRTAWWEDAFNVLNGWLHVPTPAETHVHPASAASGVTMYLPVAPSSLSNWAWGAVMREI